MTSYIMAIDQGTTSTRAILFDKASNIVGVAQKELENYYPHPGWVEQNANDIWASTIGVMFEVLAKTGVRDTQVAAIGITNQRETTVVWDKESGQPIYFAIVWQSRQSDTYCQKLKEQGLEGMIREKPDCFWIRISLPVRFAGYWIMWRVLRRVRKKVSCCLEPWIPGCCGS